MIVGMSLSCSGLNGLAHSGSAISDDANKSAEIATSILLSRKTSQSLFGSKTELLDQVASLISECSKEGWDGYGALPLDPNAFSRVIELIYSLPDGFPLPEISPEPDGSISLDWISSKRRMLSVSVGKSDRLPYAWINGTDRGHGVVRSAAYSFPLKIMNEIQDVMGHAAPSLRLAV